MEMMLKMLKPFASKITSAIEDMSEKKKCKVKYLIENHYQLDTTVLSYEQYMALSEESKNKVTIRTIILLLAKNEQNKYEPFETIDFLDIFKLMEI